MNNVTKTITATCILVAVLFSVYYVFFRQKNTTPSINTPTQTFPINQQIDTPPRITPETSTTTTIGTTTGRFLFTAEDMNMLVASATPIGNDEAWYTLEKNNEFEIDILQDSTVFNVFLCKIPIDEGNRAAEAYLLKKLNVTAEQLCELDIDVFAPDGNGGYNRSVDMGFSACPGPKMPRQW